MKCLGMARGLAVGAVLVASVAVTSARSGASSPAGHQLMLAESGSYPFTTVTLIDVTAGTAGAPIGMGTDIHSMTITPDGRTAWIGGANSIVPLDIGSGTVGTPIPIFSSTGSSPGVIAINPTGTMAWVGVDPNIVPVNLVTRTAGAPITLTSAGSIAITPNGKTLWVSNWFGPSAGDSSTITPINAATGAVGTPITVGQAEGGLSITPDGKYLYALIEPQAPQTAAPIIRVDLTTRALTTVASIGWYVGSTRTALSPDGKTMMLSDPSRVAVNAVNLTTGSVSAPLHAGANPLAVTFDPSGSRAYVAGGNDNVLTPIILKTMRAGSPVPGGAVPRDVAAVPDPAPTAAFSTTSAPHGSSSIFDAAGSTAPIGSVRAYKWSFGDGATQSTKNAKITHIFAAARTYTVTLTVTDTAGTSTKVIFTGQMVSRNGGPSATTTQSATIP